MRRNPDWTDEELTLALWLLRRLEGQRISKSHREVIALSDTLRRLPIHARADRIEPFRDPDGVRRRLTYLAQLEAGAAIPGHQAYRDVLARFPRGASDLEDAARQILERYKVERTRS